MSTKIGFWRETADGPGTLPFPEEYTFTGDYNGFVQRLQKLKTTIVRRDKGWSECRVCGKRNGSHELEWETFRFPSGYLHYLIDHRVKPDDAFYEAVMRNQETELDISSSRR